MHKHDQESTILQALGEGHTITAACKKAGLSRMTYNRLYRNNHEFRKRVDEALRIGIETNNDRASSSLMRLVQEGKWPAVQYHLSHHVHPYKERAERKKSDRSEHDWVMKELGEYLVRHRPIPQEKMNEIMNAMRNFSLTPKELMEQVEKSAKEERKSSELLKVLEKQDAEARDRLSALPQPFGRQENVEPEKSESGRKSAPTQRSS